MKNIKRFHPGSYLKDVLDECQISLQDFVLKLNMNENRLDDILNENVSITEKTVQISQLLSTSKEKWINLQNSFDLYQTQYF